MDAQPARRVGAPGSRFVLLEIDQPAPRPGIRQLLRRGQQVGQAEVGIAHRGAQPQQVRDAHEAARCDAEGVRRREACDRAERARRVVGARDAGVRRAEADAAQQSRPLRSGCGRAPLRVPVACRRAHDEAAAVMCHERDRMAVIGQPRDEQVRKAARRVVDRFERVVRVADHLDVVERSFRAQPGHEAVESAQVGREEAVHEHDRAAPGTLRFDRLQVLQRGCVLCIDLASAQLIQHRLARAEQVVDRLAEQQSGHGREGPDRRRRGGARQDHRDK